MNESLPRTCAFPGCTRPPAAATAGGRPPKYCDLPDHNRTTAFRARQTATSIEADKAGERAVSMASSRLRLVVESLPPLLASHREALTAQIVAALDALDDIGDPAMVEAEIGAVKADALRQASEAEADAERARQQTAAAEQRAAQAEAGEREALIQAEASAAGAAAAEQERDSALARAEAAELGLQQTQEQLDLARGESAKLQSALAAAQASAEAARAAEEKAVQDARRTEERESTRADREIARIQTLADERVAQLLAELAELRAEQQPERPVRRGRGSKSDA